MQASQERIIVNTFLQEIGLLILAKGPIKDKIREAADKSRGRIMADLNQEERELYQASRDIIVELANQLARCQNMDMLMKTLQIVQALTQGQISEYETIKEQIIEQPQTTI